jgi:hypothetical protein
MAITRITKRGGSIAEFDRSRIESAIAKAYAAIGTPTDELSLSILVDRVMLKIFKTLLKRKLHAKETLR